MLERVRDGVAKHGWFCTAVLPAEGQAGLPFCYSTGFQANLGCPDLLMVGFDPNLSQRIMASAFTGQKSNRIRLLPDGGKVAKVIEKFDVFLKPLSDAQIEQLAFATVAFNGDQPTRMHQLILPDMNGLFPQDPGVDPRYLHAQDIDLLMIQQPDDFPGFH